VADEIASYEPKLLIDGVRVGFKTCNASLRRTRVNNRDSESGRTAMVATDEDQLVMTIRGLEKRSLAITLDDSIAVIHYPRGLVPPDDTYNNAGTFIVTQDEAENNSEGGQNQTFTLTLESFGPFIYKGVAFA
jgi:hypothetical protein